MAAVGQGLALSTCSKWNELALLKVKACLSPIGQLACNNAYMLFVNNVEFQNISNSTLAFGAAIELYLLKQV